MAIAFREVILAPLRRFTAAAPDGAVIGVVGEDGAGKSTLLRLAAGLQQPASGEVAAGQARRFLGPLDALDLGPADLLALDHPFARRDAVVRARAASELEKLRRSGATILLASHEQELLCRLCDEIWWLRDGILEARGHPRQILETYHRHVAARLAAIGQGNLQPMSPSLRRGDGRATVLSIETRDDQGRPAITWRSGAPAAIAVTVRYDQPVENPVIGIMIRTRIGFEVYGTNTELEGLRLGPCSPGETLRVLFSFCCHLCPQEYSVTAASHDPDGVWHDWLEDAVAVSVADSRYTAGVANLRAAVTAERV